MNPLAVETCFTVKTIKIFIAWNKDYFGVEQGSGSDHSFQPLVMQHAL